jgi:hypothetical protein
VVIAELPESAGYLRPLVGRWAGEGEGLWIADKAFRYREEVVWATTGKGFLTYHQTTWALDDARALHTETGYLRATGGGGVEALIVQPTGFSEIHVGTFLGEVLALELVALGRCPTALAVTDICRHLALGPDTLSYSVRMAMNHEPLANHLSGHLRRQDGP